MADTTIKAINAATGRVGGYLVVWGSPQQRDLQGEYFTPDTDLGLEWYAQRPALYHHGLDGDMQAATVGVIDTLKMDDTGLWAEAQLDLRKRYVQAVMRLVEKGALGWSSGSLPHLVQVDGDGHIRRWPIVEGSLTPTPAEPRHTEINSIKSLPQPPELRQYVFTIKSAYDALGLDTARLQLPDLVDPAAEPAKEPHPAEETATARKDVEVIIQINPEEECDEDETLVEEETPTMNPQEMIAQILAAILAAKPDWQLTPEEQAALVQQIAAQMQPAEAMAATTPEQVQAVAQQVAPAVIKALTDHFQARDAAKAANGQVIADAVKNAMLASPPIPRVAPFTGSTATIPTRTNNPAIVGSTKYADLTAKDMSFMAMLDRFNRSQSGKYPDLKPIIPDENYGSFMNEMSTKAAKDINERKLAAEKHAVKAINAMKANELDHSTQASYGDEWVPDLWSNDLWRRARLDNVILPLFRTIEMPSNPFELPVESADPTVYFVPETTQESELTISGSGNPIPDSKIGSGKVTLTAKKLALRVGFSAELVEDSIIPVLNIYREQAERSILDAIDHVLLNGDDTNAGTGNINSDDADPADTEKYLAFDGLLHSALVEDTTRRLDAGGAAPTLALIRATRFKMPAVYAQRPKDIAYIVGGEVFARLLNLDEFLTMEKIGNQATILNGMIGMIDGSPVLTSAELALAEADGKKSATPGNNTLGRMAAVFRPNWFVGYRRRVAVSVDYLPYYDSYQLTATVRLAFVHQDNDSVGVLYDLAV